MHWPNFHFAAKFGHGVWNSFIVSFKLSPSDSFCKIWFVYFLSSTSQKNCVVLWKSKYWTYQRRHWSVWLVKGPDLSNVSADDEKVYFFTKTLVNIIQNIIPQETIICDNRDLPWINKEIKKLMVEKNLAFKSYCCSNKNMFLFEKFKALQNQLNI